jgi:hypothetical protein
VGATPASKNLGHHWSNALVERSLVECHGCEFAPHPPGRVVGIELVSLLVVDRVNGFPPWRARHSRRLDQGRKGVVKVSHGE